MVLAVKAKTLNYKSSNIIQTFSMHVYSININYMNRIKFLLTVICCPIYHWFEVSRKVGISRARFDSNTQERKKKAGVYGSSEGTFSFRYLSEKKLKQGN